MLFNESIFWLFFSFVFILYFMAEHKEQNIILLIASYVFYGYWDWRFLSLIFISTVIDYFCGLKVYENIILDAPKEEISKFKKLWRSPKFFVFISALSNLSILGFFKYFNFFVSSFSVLMNTWGIPINFHGISIILPVGISFYTFQTMSYTIDIYQKELQPTRNFFDFALYVSFFPQLVAGPIERAKNLLPQVCNKRRFTRERVQEGVYLIVSGLWLKIFCADNMALLVNDIFNNTKDPGGTMILVGVYAFSFQIFGDFAGYSNIARGCSKILGFDLMVNFRQPFLVKRPAEFWKHWHISLSSWLKDYLYIPLGGNRKGKLKTYRNLIITMILGGLWHGAAITFVLWGIYHGLILVIDKILFEKLIKNRFQNMKSWFWGFLNILVMYHITCYGWLIFRSNNRQMLINFSKKLLFDQNISAISINYILIILIYGLPIIIWQMAELRFGEKLIQRVICMKSRFALYVAMILSMIIIGNYFTTIEFIYFQF